MCTLIFISRYLYLPYSPTPLLPYSLMHHLRCVGLVGNETISGSGGFDWIIGARGEDELFGLEGNETIYGGKGDDILSGGLGHDFLSGDRGDDIFVLATGEGADTIADFNNGDDLIALSAGLTFSELSFAGNSILVDETKEILATVTGVDTTTLTESDFVIV
ncbi:MAG: hypothetical protein SWX82_17090 [Cyanobacteriota bacterium]|nr:hypothetical protein [Cyanobacteriota bacterium]